MKQYRFRRSVAAAVLAVVATSVYAAPHVQFMATVCRFLDDRGRERCLGAKTPDELYDVLVGT